MRTIAVPPPLKVSELESLAPPHFRKLGRTRYLGNDERVTTGFFAPEDQKLLHRIYGALQALLQLLAQDRESGLDSHRGTAEFILTSTYSELIEDAADLGHATLKKKSDPRTARILHDLRGGAFQALSFRLQLFAVAPRERKGLRNLFFLARDHLKIMRHCVQDLDPVQFKHDARRRHHDAKVLVEKWDGAEFHRAEGPAQVRLKSTYEGHLCESCLEMCTLDRVIYNVVNNAAHHSADGVVDFYMVPIPARKTENVRFVVVNKITEAHQQVLQSHFPQDFSGLFDGNFSTTEGGMGLPICADFCARAYGVDDFETAKREGYFGARTIRDSYVAWFHWPVARAPR